MSRKKLAAEQTVTKLRQIEVSLAQGKKTAIACKEVDPTDQSNRLKRDLVLQALDRALALRNPPPDCIHHTDRGSQYCSHDYQRRLQQLGFNVSMSGKGNCYDNAAVETFFKTIKAELIWRRIWATREQVTQALFQYINCFYNIRRRHSATGGVSPITFERQAA